MSKDGNIIQLLARARELGISIFLEEGKLQLKIPQSKRIENDFLTELRINLESILKFLNQESDNFADRRKQILPINKGSIKKIPLSYSQESAWLVDKVHGDVIHRMPMVLKFSGHLNTAALQLSLAEMVERHTVLKTIICEEDGKAYQKLISGREWTLGFSHLNQSTKGLDDVIRDIVERKFDLQSDYMMRAHLIKKSNTENYLVIIFHHIASDGWSQSIFSKEAIELYQSKIEQRAPDLKPLDIQYADYAFWQRQYLDGIIFNKKISFWEDKLNDFITLELPVDFDRPKYQSTKGADITRLFDKELSNKIRDLCTQNEVTLYMLLLSTFDILLYAYTGQDDICIGTPVANRSVKEVNNLIGYFVNTIPLRLRIDPQSSFNTFLKYVKEECLECFNFQEVPLERIVSNTVKSRDTQKHPLFQTLFVLQNNESQKEIFLDGVTIEQYEPYDLSVIEFDLILSIQDTPNGLDMTFSYCSDLFMSDTIQRLAENYEFILRSIVNNPFAEVGQLRKLNTSERNKLLIEFNNYQTYHPKDKTIIDLFEKQVFASPQSIAISFGEECVTYGELNERINKLSHYLIETGIGFECPIALCIERSIEMVVGMLAVLKAGAMYIAIPPAYPERRIKFIVEDTKARLVICDRQTERFVSLFVPHVLNIDDTEFLNSYSGLNPEIAIDSRQLIYMVYTSGSTGNPKAVMTEHHSLVYFIYPMIDILKTDKNTSFLALASYSFDGSCLEIFLPLISGGRVVIVDKESVTDANRLVKLIERSCPTHIQATPSGLKLLLAGGWKNKEKAVIISGGEPISEDLKNILVSLSDSIVWNFYGPTETTLYATMKILTLDEKVTIGHPIPNYLIFIVNNNLQLVPIGVTGEVLIGGNGIARGYYQADELTSEKFITNPFNIGSKKLYRTGDLGKWTATGDVQLIGRKDDQVKIRGYRIETGEIESALLRSGMVKQCVVLARKDGNDEFYLCAYIQPIGKFNRANINTFLERTLPSFMIPSFILEVIEFSLTPNGKLNKKSLLDPLATHSAETDYKAPQNSPEKQLIDIWQELLYVSSIGVNDNFFEVGGNSLLAVRLMAQIMLKFNKQLPITTLFESPTISLLAKKIASEEDQYLSSVVIGLNKYGHKIPFFCTPAVGGEPVSFYEMAKKLGNDQPVYPFAAKGLNGIDEPYQSIEEMAADYIKEICRINGTGPFILVGYSFGGRTSFEMAVQLEKNNNHPNWLIIFDALPPDKKNIDYSEFLPSSYGAWLVVMARIINHTFSLSDKLRISLESDEMKGMSNDEALDLLHKKVSSSTIQITKEQLKGHINVYISNSSMRYRPSQDKINSPIILFKSTIKRSFAFDSDLVQKREEMYAEMFNKNDYGWSEYSSKKVFVYEYDCSHEDLMTGDFLQDIIKKIETHLLQ